MAGLMKTYNARKKARLSNAADVNSLHVVHPALLVDQPAVTLKGSDAPATKADPYSFDLEEAQEASVAHNDPTFLLQLAANAREGACALSHGEKGSDRVDVSKRWLTSTSEAPTEPRLDPQQNSSDGAPMSYGSNRTQEDEAAAAAAAADEQCVGLSGRVTVSATASQGAPTDGAAAAHRSFPTIHPHARKQSANRTQAKQDLSDRGARPTRSAPAALALYEGASGQDISMSHRIPSSQPVESMSGSGMLMPPPPPRVVQCSGASTASGQMSRFARGFGAPVKENATVPACSAASDRRKFAGAMGGERGKPGAAKGGLARALHAKMASARLVKGPTVTEAQESGEQWHILDNVVYALDGLKSGRPSTRRESAATLADLCSSRRARIAVRSDRRLFSEVMGAAASLMAEADAVVCLAFAVLLLAFSQDEAHRAVLASPAAATLLLNLLQAQDVDSTEVETDPSVARLQKLLRGPLGKGLPRAESCSPSSLALFAVTRATDPQQSSTGMEALKQALLENGVLEQVARLAALRADALPLLDTEGPGQALQPVEGLAGESASATERCLWSLRHALLALENASFACPANEGHLTALQLASRSGEGQGRSLAACLLEVADFLGLERDAISPASRRACLHALLSVLMNMTHAQERGCSELVASGGLPIIARLLQAALGETPDDPAADRAAVLEQMDILSVALGVLINVAENGREWRRHLAEVAFVPSQPGNGQPALGLLPLLCRLVKTRSAGADGEASLRRRDSTGGVEVTEAALRRGEEDGNVAMVEVYAALLLGFLVEGDATACQAAAFLLPGGNLETVANAVERCLRFYVDAGAITARTESSLRRLLASLNTA